MARDCVSAVSTQCILTHPTFHFEGLIGSSWSFVKEQSWPVVDQIGTWAHQDSTECERV